MDSYFVAGLCAGVPALFTWWLYGKRRDYCKILEDIKQYEAGPELTNALSSTADKCIPYCAVTGLVKAEDVPLYLQNSNGDTSRGVIYKISRIEHKSEWNRNSNEWVDVKRIVSQNQNTVPFVLHSKKNDSISETRVSVAEPLWASGLTYVTVRNNFETAGSSFSDNLFSLASGEKVKGYETTEEMLLEGTKLTGLGKVEILSGKLIFGPPDRSLKYILSTDSLKRIVSSETSLAKFLKGLSIFFTICGGVLLSIWAYRILKKWYIARKQKQEFENLQNDVNSAAGNGNECLICMDRPRNIVILDCGHICVCKECGRELSTCPICGSDIVRVVPTFSA